MSSFSGEYLGYCFQWRIGHLICATIHQKVKCGKRFTTEELIQIIHKAEECFEVKCTSEVFDLFLKDARRQEARLQWLNLQIYKRINLTSEELDHINIYARDLKAAIAGEGAADESSEGAEILYRKGEGFIRTYVPENESFFCEKKPKSSWFNWYPQSSGDSDKGHDTAVESYRASHLKPFDRNHLFANTVLSLILSSTVQGQYQRLTKAELLQIIHTAEEKSRVKFSDKGLELHLRQARKIVTNLFHYSRTLSDEDRRKSIEFFSTYFISEEESVLIRDKKPEQSDTDDSCEVDKGPHRSKENNEKDDVNFDNDEEEEEEEEEEMFAYGGMCELKPLISREELDEKTSVLQNIPRWSYLRWDAGVRNN
jgi:hypothetical protein